MNEHVKNILILLALVFFGCIVSGMTKYQTSQGKPTSLNEVHAAQESKEIQEQITQAQLDIFYEAQMNKYFGGKLKGKALATVEYARENNIHPCLLGAIFTHETGNGTSKAIRTLNNPAGIMVNGKYLRQFKTMGEQKNMDDGIWYTAQLLKKDYIGKGRMSIADIQKKYCPVGVANDPTGLNKHWLNGVTKWYNVLRGE